MKEFLANFLYSVMLYSGTALFLGVAAYFFYKKREIRIALAICIAAVVFDLAMFDLVVGNRVLSRREKIMFNERPTPFVFKDKRAISMLSDDVFNNFRPTLYKKHVAMSSRSLVPSFFMNKMKVKLYTLFLGPISEYPLEKELDTMTTEELVKYGMAHMDEWSAEERIFFSDVLLSIVESFSSYKYFYLYYTDIGGTFEDVLRDIRDGLPYFSKNSEVWSLKNDARGKILAMLQLPLMPMYEVEKADVLKMGKIKFLRDQKFFQFVFGTLSAREYLTYSVENSIADEHIFVLLKNFYDLAFCNKNLSPIEGHFVPLGHKVKQVMGIEAPIIRFYSGAQFVGKKDVLANFGYSMPVDNKLLLIGEKSMTVGDEASVNDFSYKVSYYDPNTLSIDYEAGSEGFVYYSDCFDDHWKAFIDGKKTDIYLANAAFKAVKAPKGRHEVKFVYDPALFRYSLWCYYITFFICMAYLIVGALLKVNKK